MKIILMMLFSLAAYSKGPIVLKKGDTFKCQSVVNTWRGSCIHTNKGWLPKACQDGLRVSLSFEPLID